MIRSAARRLGLRRPIRLGALGGMRPISTHWGADRGMPIDRYYIERFLAYHRGDIGGDVLEIKDAQYTRQFGSAVTRSDVLDIDAANPHANVVADLTDAREVPSESYDCVILTQTLHIIYALQTAIASVHRLLRPGGVLLATVPAVSRIDAHTGADSDFWRLTPAACRCLFGDVFGRDQVVVHGYGNVLAAISFLTGLAREDIGDTKLDVEDELYPVLVAVRAVRA